MIPLFLIIFIFFTGGVSLLAATGQLFVINRRKENFNLFGLFFCIGLILIQYAALLTTHLPAVAGIMNFHISLLYLFGPLLFLAYYIVVHPHRAFPTEIVKFFIPAIITFIADIYIFLQPTGWKKELMSNFYAGINSLQVIILKALLAGACLQIIIYLVYLLVKIIPAWKHSDKNSIMNITIIYSFSSLAATIILMAGYILNSLVLICATASLTAVCLIFSYLLGQRYPRFLQLLRIEVKERQYRRSLLNGLDTETVCQDLVSLVEKEKLYADENITLKNLAERIDMTAHQLSQLLNEKLNVNFYTFINKYRIQEARRILTEEPDKSIIAIAYDVGFNSKSSFYEAFSKFTGKTPYRYRKDALDSK